MANTFYNEVLDVTTTNQDVVAAADVTGTGIVLTLRATNVDGTNDATVTVEVVKASSAGNAFIASTISVPADSTLELAGKSKLVLEAGDKIQALASADNDIEIFCSWLHIT